MTDLTLVYVSNELKRGLDLIEKGDLSKAYQFFENYSQKEPTNAMAMSFLGYLTASFHQKPYQGLELCLKSVKAEKEEPLIYLNLARIYIQLNDRYHAYHAIQTGLKYRHSPFRADLLNFYRLIGVRKKAPLPFLHRNHPINKFIGKMIFKIKPDK
jgi:uncharacterized protein HemY